MKKLAQSNDIQKIANMISEYFYGSTIELKQILGIKKAIWEIHNKNGLVRGHHVEMKNRRFTFIREV